MQENEVKNGALTIEGYYASLSKKEKSQLIQFLMTKYGFCYNTVQQKLSGRTKFNRSKTATYANFHEIATRNEPFSSEPLHCISG